MFSRHNILNPVSWLSDTTVIKFKIILTYGQQQSTQFDISRFTINYLTYENTHLQRTDFINSELCKAAI